MSTKPGNSTTFWTIYSWNCTFVLSLSTTCIFPFSRALTIASRFFSRLTSSSECTHIGHYYALKSCFRNIETDHEASIRSFMDVVFSFFPFYTSFSISTSPNTEFHLYRFICMYSYVCQCWKKLLLPNLS